MNKKYGIVYLLIVAICMSVVTALIIPALNGMNITLGFFGLVFGCSFVLTMVLGLILPLPKIAHGFCKVMCQDPNSGLGKIFAVLVNTALMMVFLTLIMVGILTGIGEVDGVNYLTRAVHGYLNIFPVAATAMILLDPMIVSLATRIAGAPDQVPEKAAKAA